MTVPEGYRLVGKERAASSKIPKGYRLVESPPAPPPVSAPPVKEPDYFRSPSEALEQAVGYGEAALAFGSAAVAEPISGLAGASMAANFGAKAGSDAVESTRDMLSYQPRTTGGQEKLQALAQQVEPIAAIMEMAEKFSGDYGYDIAGPIGGAIGTAAPTAVAEALGLATIRGTKNVVASAKRVAASEIAPDAKSLIDSGKSMDVPLMTSDVIPPETFMGKWVQQMSEKLGPLGSAGKREIQQKSRQDVVEGLASEYEVALNSPNMENIIRSLSEKSAQVLGEAASRRNSSIDALVPYGVVPVSQTIITANRQLRHQKTLGAKANAAHVQNLKDIKSSIKDGDFSVVADIRTEVIDDIKALDKSEDARASGSLLQVKKAIDRDMQGFANANDPKAARDWARSNREFTAELGKIRGTEIKRMLNKGDATPEMVLSVLKGGKRSELARLRDSLTKDGRASARAAIISDALDESGYMRGDLNPDKLATALSKTKRKQAIDVFFTVTDKKQLDGLVRLLDATRRAQQSKAIGLTGIQNVPMVGSLAMGYGALVNAWATMGVVSTLSAFTRAYESKAFRTLLLKVANTKKGSKAETGLVETAYPAFVEGFNATGEEQQ